MEKREKILVGILLIIALGAGYFYLDLPFWENYLVWGQEIEENLQQIRVAQRRAAELDRLIEDYRQIQRELREAQRKLPEEGEFFELLASLEQEAERAGIPSRNIRSFERGAERTRDQVREMSIQAQFAEITIGQLARLLWSYDDLERLIDIERLRVRPVRGKDSFNVDLELMVYMLREGES